MSIEHEVREEDKVAAMELLKSEPLLASDEYSNEVIENDGKVDSGNVVDIGHFLSARLAYLQKEHAEEKVAAMQKMDPEAYLAAIAVRGDLEHGLER